MEQDCFGTMAGGLRRCHGWVLSVGSHWWRPYPAFEGCDGLRRRPHRTRCDNGWLIGRRPTARAFRTSRRTVSGLLSLWTSPLPSPIDPLSATMDDDGALSTDLQYYSSLTFSCLFTIDTLRILNNHHQHVHP